MSETKSILLFGATGYIGKHITHSLLSSGLFPNIAIFTSPSTAESKAAEIQLLKDRGVRVIVGDAENEEDLKKAYTGVDTIISATGRGSILSQIKQIQLAAATPNIKKFLPSEFGTDIYHSPSSPLEKPAQNKIQVRKALESLHEGSLDYTYVVTGPFSDGYLTKSKFEKAGSFDVLAKTATVIGDGKGEVSLTSCSDTGKLVLGVLKHPAETKNIAVRVNSFTTTPLKIVAEFERQTGHKWTVNFTTHEDLRSTEKESWEKKEPYATLYTLRRIWSEGGTLYEKRDNGLVGMDDATDTQTLEDVVKEAIQQQIGGR